MKDFFLTIIYKILAYKARLFIKYFDPFVIAITGSVGKTSTKEAVYTVLKESFGEEVRKNEGNLNAEIGIPLTILGYKKVPNKFIWPFFIFGILFKRLPKKYPKYLVLEMGVEHKGDIKYFCSIARPDIGIITSATAAHIANFANEEEYRKEKLSLVDEVKEGGKVVINADDLELNKIERENILSVGVESKSATYSAEDIKLSITGTEYRIVKSGYKVAVKTGILGKQMIYSFLFAFAIADILELPLIKSAKALDKIKPIPGRMNLIKGRNNITIIDDTYNANPSSMKAALDFLDKVKFEGKKVAILGNMNELGKLEKEEHEKLAQYAKDKADLVIFAGPNSKAMFQAFGNEKALAFASRKELDLKIETLLTGGELVLVKASQNNNYFEETVKKLMKNPNDAKKLLVRQGSAWLSKK